MVRKFILASCFILINCVCLTAYSEAVTKSLPTDSRAKVVAYRPYEIYSIKTHYLISTDIIFGEDELIESGNVHLGDSSAWDIDVSNNHLYIKAKKMDASGNMSVNTNKYTYHFILSVSDSSNDQTNQTFFLKFTYPTHSDDEKKIALQMVNVPTDMCKDTRKYNLKYSFTGDKELAPYRTCDDGVFTYFRFRRHIDLPAIFRVLPDKSEEVVNYRVEGNYIVIERVAKAFTLRNGSVVTSVYNDNMIGDWNKVSRVRMKS